METLVAALLQMTLSLAFHIIFAAVGIGLPLLLIIVEGSAADGSRALPGPGEEVGDFARHPRRGEERRRLLTRNRLPSPNVLRWPV